MLNLPRIFQGSRLETTARSGELESSVSNFSENNYLENKDYDVGQRKGNKLKSLAVAVCSLPFFIAGCFGTYSENKMIGQSLGRDLVLQGIIQGIGGYADEAGRNVARGDNYSGGQIGGGEQNIYQRDVEIVKTKIALYECLKEGIISREEFNSLMRQIN